MLAIKSKFPNKIPVSKLKLPILNTLSLRQATILGAGQVQKSYCRHRLEIVGLIKYLPLPANVIHN